MAQTPITDLNSALLRIAQLEVQVAEEQGWVEMLRDERDELLRQRNVALTRAEAAEARVAALEGQMGTIDLHDTTDVAVWAAEFCRIFPYAPDEGVMIGWFANAMMAKADAITRADHALHRRCPECRKHGMHRR